MTLSEILKSGTHKLESGNITDYGFEAMAILKAVFYVDTAQYIIKKNEQAEESRTELFFSLISKRITGMPLQYVLGEWDFCSRKYFVGEGVLIPRPETEELCDIADGYIKASSYTTVYDLCAGSGCIGITLAINNPQINVYMFEISEDACGYIERNIEYHGAKNAKLLRYDITEGRRENLPVPDMIVSNPPYIPSADIKSLQHEVSFEPRLALDGGEDGLQFYREIAEKWFPAVRPGGMAALECGENQAEKILKMFPASSKGKVVTDSYSAERFVFVSI